jgi:hypothetical protein
MLKISKNQPYVSILCKFAGQNLLKNTSMPIFDINQDIKTSTSHMIFLSNKHY